MGEPQEQVEQLTEKYRPSTKAPPPRRRDKMARSARPFKFKARELKAFHIMKEASGRAGAGDIDSQSRVYMLERVGGKDITADRSHSWFAREGYGP